MAKQNKKAVILLSGGLDSSTALAMAAADGFEVHGLTFLYGQRHDLEVESAKAVARLAGISDHRVVEIDLGLFAGSALTSDIAVPKGRSLDEMTGEVPVTYVPARNTIFLSYALAFGESIGADDIFIGVNALDYSGYPDCRPEYIRAFEAMANLGTKAGIEGHRIRIHTPLIQMSKAQIILAGTDLGVNYALTTSCYDPEPEGRACGACDSCILRKNGFKEAGIADPTLYCEGAL
jgi:7-cyano-7-deazaguanine synthase